MVEVHNRILFSEMKHVTVRLCSAAALTQSCMNNMWFVLQRAADLADMITRVIREGLEGLVLKDVKVHLGTSVLVLYVHIWWAAASGSQGMYEPGKRHWLKVKKDYLNEGAMADTADLVVLGAFYGKGSNGL